MELTPLADAPWENKAIRRETPPPPSPLPDWLSAYTPEEQNDMANGVSLTKFPRTKEHILLEQQVFDTFFSSTFLDAVTQGEDLTTTITRDPRGIDVGRFMRWVKKDAERNALYEEAHEIGTDIIMSKMNRIAEGTDNLEDIERSKMRLKQYEFHVKSWNKKRYGDTKQVDVNMNQTIDIRALLEQRQQQVDSLVVEGECVAVQEVKRIG